MRLIGRFLNWWTAWVLLRPALVLGMVLLTAVASVYLTVQKLDVITDQLELISTNHPLIALSDRLEIFKSHKSSFTVIVESPTPERSIEFAHKLTERLEKEPDHFKEVITRIDPNLVKPWLLLYLEKQDIIQLRDTLKEHAPLIRNLSENQDILPFLKLINSEMASRVVGELFTGFLDNPPQSQPEKKQDKAFDLSFLTVILQDLANHLNGSTQYTSPWKSLFQNTSWNLDQEGYFWEGHKRYLLLFVYPQKSEDGLNRAQDSLHRLRAIIGTMHSEFPNVAAGVTGQEALNNDEIDTVMEDMTRATWLSLLGVLLLMVLFMKGLRRPLIEMACLLVGLCWTFGWTTAVVGHLNILSVVFAPLLCGLGVDYGIHWFARYEEEERSTHGDAHQIIQAVTERSGPGIFVAGLSAALSFLPFVLTGFRGLVELGIITGVGIFLILLATFTVAPALSVLLQPKRQVSHSFGAMPVSQPRDLVRLSTKGRRVIIATTALVTVFCLWSRLNVHFDLNPLRLQAANAEAVVWEKTLIMNSDRSVLSAATLATSADEVQKKTQAFQKLPSVSEVESIFSLLPQDQEEKARMLHTLIPLIPEVKPTVLQNRPTDLAELLKILERIGFKMQPDAAEQEGADKKLLQDMALVQRLIGEITSAVQNRPDALERFFEYRKQFRDDLLQTWGFLRKAVSATPMTIENLPKTVRDWFFSDGKYLIRIYPKESVWEEGALTRFVTDIQRVDRTVVGDPVSLYAFAFAFRDACVKAGIYALVAVFLLLIVSLRRVSHSLLALSPLVLGTIWTVGIMGVADIQFNLANSMFMPLVVGAGVEYGVIIINRWREGTVEPGHLPLSTGKGVILAALTTTVGFGMLMISRHRGIFSLGFVAWTGSLCVLAAAIFVLPVLLSAMAPPRSTPQWRRY